MLKVAILRNAMTVDEDELWIEGYVVLRYWRMILRIVPLLLVLLLPIRIIIDIADDDDAD